uniref:Uncharacterized protein n=1 Tax=Cacopsylla melanoneura TaxID=428564 RepID=A0A8D8X0T7_9HEMI
MSSLLYAQCPLLCSMSFIQPSYSCLSAVSFLFLFPCLKNRLLGLPTYLAIPISETNDCPSYNSYLLPLCCGHLNNLSSVSCLDLHSHQSIKLCIIMLIPSHTDFNIQFCFLCLFLPTPCPRYPGQSFLILCFSCGNKAADVFCIVSV